MLRVCHVVLAAALLSAMPAAAQTSEDEQVWLNATVAGPIKDRLIYFAEVQPRIGNGVSRLETLILRPAIGWQVTKRLQLFQGFAHVEEPAADRNEERLFQQATWFVPGLPAGELQSRTRLEQRWRSDGDDMQLRLRQMLRFEYPVAKKLAPMVSVEGFWALNKPDWRARDGFDQVRTFVGAEVGLKGRSTIEVGYLNQTIDLPGRARQMNHVASVILFIRH